MFIKQSRCACEGARCAWTSCRHARPRSRCASIIPCGGPRRCFSSGTTPLSPSAQADATAPPPPPAATLSFRSTTKFKLSPTQVNETNVPSAREVDLMIPTLRELRAQLPGARELEQRYIHPESLKSSTKTADADTATPTDTIFQKTTDPLEDLLFGPPKEEAEPNATASADDAGLPRQHLPLAYRALLWGTAYALLGFCATVAVAMYVCGYANIRELMDGVRGKMERDGDRLRGAVDGDTSAPMEHYVIDLTRPTEAWGQIQEVWAAVQRIAEEEDMKAHVSPSSKEQRAWQVNATPRT